MRAHAVDKGLLRQPGSAVAEGLPLSRGHVELTFGAYDPGTQLKFVAALDGGVQFQEAEGFGEFLRVWSE
jgi:hypothetical protein